MTDTQTTERFDPTPWYGPGDAEGWHRRRYNEAGVDLISGCTIYGDIVSWYTREAGEGLSRFDIGIVLRLDDPADLVERILTDNGLLPPKIGGDDE